MAGCGDFARRSVRDWISVGGSRIDASDDYDNQRSVGLGIADSGAPRGSLFVLSKVGPGMSLGYADAHSQFSTILADMGLTYVDALLIHWPDASLHGYSNATRSSEAECRPQDPAANATLCRLNTWRALLEILASGGARAVGVSNYNESHLAEIEREGLPLPSMNQVPFNPYRSTSQAPLLAYMRQRGIVLDAYSPLGVPDAHAFPPGSDPARGALSPTILQDPVIATIAAAHAPATPAQVVFSWLWAQGLPSVPRSQNMSHMRENLAVFGLGGMSPLKLSPDEMAAMSTRPQNMCEDDPQWYECAPH
jgi:2,5-diketo-D-gluconate reductase A